MKELKRKRLEILAKIDKLVNKCDCRHSSGSPNKCSNCAAIKKLGDELFKNLAEQKKKKGVVQVVITPQIQQRIYPDGLNAKEYLYFKSLLLTDKQIAEIYDSTYHFIASYKKEFKIVCEQPRTRLSTLEAKKIIIRERKRIKQLYGKNKEVS